MADEKPVHVGLVGTLEEFAALDPATMKLALWACAGIMRALNDRELIERANRTYYDGSLVADMPGLDWFCDPDPELLKS